MFKGDIGITGECCWEPPNSTVCAGATNPQTRYNWNTEQTETQTGIGTCGECCSCGPTWYFDHIGSNEEANAQNSYEISKQQFDSFQLGGTIYWSSTTDVNFGPMSCGFSYSEAITVLPGQCMAEGFGLSATSCINDCSYYGSPCPPGVPPPVPRSSSTGINIIVFTDQGKYYVHVSGHAQCPIGNGTTICSSVYFYIGEIYTRGDDSSEYLSFLGANIRYDSDAAGAGGWTLNFIPNTPDAP